MGIAFIEGLPVITRNVVVNSKKEFHISYLRFDICYKSDTTAIYIKSTSQFLILNGDHTLVLKGLHTLEECLKYFYENLEQANFRSEHGRVFDNGKYIDGGV